jgi:hypothetical protein
LEDFGKVFKRPIVGSLRTIREATGRELLHAKMVMQAVTAVAFSRA